MSKLKCNDCGETKGAYRFYVEKRVKTGRSASCKSCHKKRAAIFYNENIKGNSHKLRQRSLLSKYNLTIEDYDAILKEQGGVCAICGNHEIATTKYGGIKRLAIDHDHSTGEVRGILCNKCNIALSMLDENLDILASAASYLINNKKGKVA